MRVLNINTVNLVAFLVQRGSIDLAEYGKYLLSTDPNYLPPLIKIELDENDRTDNKDS